MGAGADIVATARATVVAASWLTWGGSPAVGDGLPPHAVSAVAIATMRTARTFIDVRGGYETDESFL